MTELILPDYAGTYQRGLESYRRGEDWKRQNQAREGLGQYLGSGDKAGLQTAYQNDPQAAFEAQGAVESRDSDHRKRLMNMVQYLDSTPEQYKPTVYAQLLPKIKEIFPNVPISEQWGPDVQEAIHQIKALGAGDQEADKWSAAGRGFLYSQSGQTKEIPGFQEAGGANAKLVMVPDGNGGQVQMLFDPDTQQFTPPNYGGAPPQANAPQAPQGMQPTPPNIDDTITEGANAMAQTFAAQGVPEEVYTPIVEGWMNKQRSQPRLQAAPAPQAAGGVSQAPQRITAPPIGEVGGGTPAPARMGYKPPPQGRAAPGQRAAPQGYRWKPDGSQEVIPGGPADRSSRTSGARGVKDPTEDQAKAAAWFAQASNAYKNLKAVYDSDPEAAYPGVIETYSPVGEVANRSRSANRQKYVQAASSLSEAFLRAATGAGITIDEAKQKFEELTPVRGDTPEVIKQKLDQIPVYLESLKNRAGRAIPMANAPTAADASATLPPLGGPAKRLKYNPATGELE